MIRVKNIQKLQGCPRCREWTKETVEKFLQNECVRKPNPYGGKTDCFIHPNGDKQVYYEGKKCYMYNLVKYVMHGVKITKEERKLYNWVMAHECGVPNCINPDHTSIKTQIDNMADKKIHGTQTYGEEHQSSKISDEDRRIICERYDNGKGITHQALAEEYGLSARHVSNIIKEGAMTPEELEGKRAEINAKVRKSRETQEKKELTVEIAVRKYEEKIKPNIILVPVVPNDSRYDKLKTKSPLCHIITKYFYGKSEYARIGCGKYGGMKGSHYLALVAHTGELNVGKFACHMCREKACVNPEHMYFGTCEENNNDTKLRKKADKATAG